MSGFLDSLLGPIMDAAKPVAIAIAGLVSTGTVAWVMYQRILPILRQNMRDKGLSDDYERLRQRFRALRIEHDAVINHFMRLEASMQILASCVTRMASAVESMAALFPPLLDDHSHSGAFLVLVNEIKKTSNEAKMCANQAREEADQDILAIREHIAQQDPGDETRPGVEAPLSAPKR